MNQHSSWKADRVSTATPYATLQSRGNQSYTSYANPPNYESTGQSAGGQQTANWTATTLNPAMTSMASMPTQYTTTSSQFPALTSQAPPSNQGLMAAAQQMGLLNPNYGQWTRGVSENTQQPTTTGAGMGYSYQQANPQGLSTTAPLSDQGVSNQYQNIDPALFSNPSGLPNLTPVVQGQSHQPVGNIAQPRFPTGHDGVSATPGLEQAPGAGVANQQEPRGETQPCPQPQLDDRRQSSEPISNTPVRRLAWKPGLKPVKILESWTDEQKEAAKKRNREISEIKAEHVKNQNKISARKSRRRKELALETAKTEAELSRNETSALKKRIEELNATVQHLTAENEHRAQMIGHLTAQNEVLQNRAVMLEQQLQFQRTQNPGAGQPLNPALLQVPNQPSTPATNAQANRSPMHTSNTPQVNGLGFNNTPTTGQGAIQGAAQAAAQGNFQGTTQGAPQVAPQGVAQNTPPSAGALSENNNQQGGERLPSDDLFDDLEDILGWTSFNDQMPEYNGQA